jgi:hypothetical protein
VQVRSSRFLNNLIEQDHRAIKRRCASMGGFKSFRTANFTLAAELPGSEHPKRTSSFPLITGHKLLTIGYFLRGIAEDSVSMICAIIARGRGRNSPGLLTYGPLVSSEASGIAGRVNNC